MARHFITYVIALSIALAGYAPAFAMQPAMGMVSASASAAAEPMAGAESDCMKAMAAAAAADDCCGKADASDKGRCLYDDACAARCHVNAGVVVAPVDLVVTERYKVALAFTEPPPLHAQRGGPLYRPPIL